MKFLVHSNGPTVSTGYGVQTANLVRRLKADGHEVAVSCTYGQQGSVGKWEGVRLYPNGYEVNGNDVIHCHASHWFGEGISSPESDKAGWIIPLLDVWCLMNPRLRDFNMAAWTPIDHSPIPPKVHEFFLRNPDCVPIAMSRFGEREMFAAGLNPAYVPLSVDTKLIRPMLEVSTGNGGTIPCRDLFGIDPRAFVVGMVAMNKGWAMDRKGFNEAFRAFSVFRRNHPDAILFMHSEKFGAAEGLNLIELAESCGIPEHAMVWSDQYAYRIGLPSDMMSAAYSSMDVLLAPSHGEGFCVPMVEAQACGTPVIASDFSAQSELVGAGWLVKGQPEWDQSQHSNYLMPFIHEIIQYLEDAYALDAETRAKMSAEAYRFALGYDADVVFEKHWRPLIERLEKIQTGAPVQLERDVMVKVDVIVPLVRKANRKRLTDSFDATNDGSARLLFGEKGSLPTKTYAENVNEVYANAVKADWICVVGDDVEFKPGWIEAARAISDRFDVIGTNDTDGPVKNKDVAAGRHADHFFIRCAYIEQYGSSLDGPGVVMPDAYRHWFTDKEVIELAKVRRVWSPCLESVIVHHHPGYDGDEKSRGNDPVYMAAVAGSEEDRKTWLSRLPLIQQHRT